MKNKMVLPEAVTLGEVSLRDGLQHEQAFVPTDAKIYMVEALADAGYRCIEVTSFANPRYLPQFRDCDEVLKRIKRRPGITYSTINISQKAVERAVEARQQGWGPDKIVSVIATSESYNLRNAGLPQAEHWPKLGEWVRMAHDAGMRFCGCISTIWGCSIEGLVPIERAYEFADRFFQMGADEIEYGDTTGKASPDKVFDFYATLLDRYPAADTHIAHFHETHGWGLSNCLAALQAGVTRFESSLGGLGGPPADLVDRVPVPWTGAVATPVDLTGNVRTEDLVVMLDEMGIATGLDVDRVLEIGRLMERILGRRLRSYSTETGRIR